MRNLGAAVDEGLAMADDPHSHDHAHGSELSEMQIRVRALETILTEKGYIDPAALDQIVENVETRIGPHIGARIVARAWLDAEFKRRLLEDASEAVNALAGFDPVAAHLIAVENTPQTQTSSSVRCAPAIRGRCWACRRSGTNRRLTARAR